MFHLPNNSSKSFLADLRRRFARDSRGAALVEFVMLFPVLAGILGLIVFGCQGFEIDRKLTMTVRTLADLASRQTNLGGTSTTYTYTEILTAAALVMAPYGDTNLSMVISEVQTNGTTSGTVVWSKATSNGTALTAGSTVTLPSDITTSGYLVLGQAQYNYNPMQIFYAANMITLQKALFLAPRNSSSIACCS